MGGASHGMKVPLFDIMKKIRFKHGPKMALKTLGRTVCFAILIMMVPFTRAQAEMPTRVPSGIDHTDYDRLLRKYVDDRGLVDYGGWKGNKTDFAALKNYLGQFSLEPEEIAGGDELIASLINAYNAFTIHFILMNYPTESIRLLNEPFDGKRHKVGGKWISVDTIEHKMLRPLIGWKVHAVVVCAARSCPPLLNRAYFPGTWEEQMRERYRAWLAREDLNSFDTKNFRNTAEISKIFKWYEEDFKGEHRVKNVLSRFGPEKYATFLSGDFRIRFKEYHWGLNDQSDLGKNYKHGVFRGIFGAVDEGN